MESHPHLNLRLETLGVRDFRSFHFCSLSAVHSYDLYHIHFTWELKQIQSFFDKNGPFTGLGHVTYPPLNKLPVVHCLSCLNNKTTEIPISVRTGVDLMRRLYE